MANYQYSGFLLLFALSMLCLAFPLRTFLSAIVDHTFRLFRRSAMEILCGPTIGKSKKENVNPFRRASKLRALTCRKCRGEGVVIVQSAGWLRYFGFASRSYYWPCNACDAILNPGTYRLAYVIGRQTMDNVAPFVEPENHPLPHANHRRQCFDAVPPVTAAADVITL
jgi:hypothetical protein